MVNGDTRRRQLANQLGLAIDAGQPQGIVAVVVHRIQRHANGKQRVHGFKRAAPGSVHQGGVAVLARCLGPGWVKTFGSEPGGQRGWHGGSASVHQEMFFSHGQLLFSDNRWA